MRTTIGADEFAQRRVRATDVARERGLKGLMVCARGGGSVDRYGDVMYLSNFYTAFPFIPDRQPDWSARAHAFVLLPFDGPAVLVCDVKPGADDHLPIEEVVVANDMVAALAQELAARGMAEGEIGVAGADAVPWGAMRKLEAEAPKAVWREADDIMERIRLIKSPGEVALLRASSAMGSRAIDAMLDAAVAGATQGAVMLAGLEVMVPEGGILYNSFMSAGRGGGNAQVCASDFPTWAHPEPLADGQWFHVGLSGVLDGYYFDHARSGPIGDAQPEQIRVFEAPIAAVQAGIAAIKSGATAADVAIAARIGLEGAGFPLEGSFLGFGHGIGLGWDAPWLIPDDDTPLEPGMVLCVERSVRHAGFYGDFEETVLVTDEGCELLTDAVVRRW